MANPIMPDVDHELLQLIAAVSMLAECADIKPVYKYTMYEPMDIRNLLTTIGFNAKLASQRPDTCVNLVDTESMKPALKSAAIALARLTELVQGSPK